MVKVSAAIFYVLAYLGYVFILPFRHEGGGWLLAFYGFIFGSGFIAFFALRKSHERDKQVLHFSLTDRRSRPSEAGQLSSANRSYLWQRAVIVGTLINRAGSEIRRANGHVAVSARATENHHLRQTRLWEHLEPIESVLMSKPEGTWSEHERSAITTWCEQLRVLRWVLGADTELMPMEHFPRPDFRLTEGLDRLDPKGSSHVDAWEMRLERDKSATYVTRALVELKARNLLPTSPKDHGLPGDLRDELKGNSTDSLAGTKTISELDEPALRLLAVVAAARMQYTAWLVDRLNSHTSSSFVEWLRLQPGTN